MYNMFESLQQHDKIEMWSFTSVSESCDDTGAAEGCRACISLSLSPSVSGTTCDEMSASAGAVPF